MPVFDNEISKGRGDNDTASSTSSITKSETKTLAKIIEELSYAVAGTCSEPETPQASSTGKTIEADNVLLTSTSAISVTKTKKRKPELLEEDQTLSSKDKKSSAPEALPLLKLMEHFLGWIDDEETERTLMSDILAIKDGLGPDILLEVTAAARNANVTITYTTTDDDETEEDSPTVRKRSSHRRKSKKTDLLLNITPTGSDDIPPSGQGDGYPHRSSPIGSPPILRNNPLSPTIPSPPPVQFLLLSPSSANRSPNRGQAGLPPLSPDFLTSKHSRSPTSVENSRKNKESVPRFYWPEGKPPPTPYVHETISKAESEFSKFATPTTKSVNYEEFGKYLQSLGVSLYWKKPFWTALGLLPSSNLELEPFKNFYKSLISQCPDEASRFMRIVWTSRAVLKETGGDFTNFPSGNALGAYPIDFKRIELHMSDFVPLIQDIIDTHPGLGFLREAPEFHSRYVTTVISRIFYKVNRSWTARLTLSEIRRSNLLRVIKRLEEETDVNAITDYFSYEHFYVIYCKFWELDKDHDLLIEKADLARHNDQSLSTLIVDRIFSGTVLRGWDINTSVKCPPGKMTYSDFVWFIISEEDKRDPTAIEYWFRCLDLDGDGVLSPYELQHFYREQESRIISLGIEPLDFSNIFCQMVDMLRCSPKGVRLNDLKKNPQLAATFLNTLFNLDKYLDHEQRDPFASSGTGLVGIELNETGETDWDRFAASEYELLIAEESPSEHIHNDSSDFEELPS